MGQVINRPDHFRSRERISIFPGFEITVESAMYNIDNKDADGYLEINWSSEVNKRDPSRYVFKVLSKLEPEVLAIIDEYKLANLVARSIENVLKPHLMEPITVVGMALADGYGFSYQRHCTLPRVEKVV